MLLLKDIVKNYQTGTETVNALKGVSISFRKSEFVSILGQSGCGKTTLLNIVGGLDRYTSGDLVINGRSTKDYLDKFWELIDEILNAILFLFIGFELLLIPNIISFWKIGLICIAIVLFARFISIWIPTKIIPFKKKFEKSTIKILVWGGLRGGVSIALALSIAEGPNKQVIIAITYFVVVFSIIVQGLTIGKLANKILPKAKSAKV